MAAEHREPAPIHQEQGGAPDPNRRRRAQQLRLDAGRVLLLLGGLVVAIVVPAARNTKNPGGGARAANTACAFVGFFLWILGVCLLTAALTPAARRFPRAGAAVASAVLKCFLPPVN